MPIDRRRPRTFRLAVTVGFIASLLTAVGSYIGVLFANDFVAQRDARQERIEKKVDKSAEDIQDLKEFKAFYLAQNEEMAKRMDRFEKNQEVLISILSKGR